MKVVCVYAYAYLVMLYVSMGKLHSVNDRISDELERKQSWKTLVRTVGFLAEIQTEHLSNMSGELLLHQPSVFFIMQNNTTAMWNTLLTQNFIMVSYRLLELGMWNFYVQKYTFT
jgi:hypothetical protein